jgi:hypothetical protein
METLQPNFENESEDRQSGQEQANHFFKDTDLDKKSFERLREGIEMNHTLAIKMSSIEQLFDEAGELDPEDPGLKRILRSLPDSYRYLFERDIETLNNFQKEAESQHQHLKKLVEKQREFGVEKENEDTAGSLIFRSLTDRDPKSEITYEQEAGYHLLKFTSIEDYNAAKDTKKASEGLHVDRKYIGIFKPESPYATLLLVAPQRSEDSVEGTALHERQHYINQSVFGRFLKTEGYSGLEKEKGLEGHKKFWKIKDELLAQLRNNSFNFAHVLKPDGYYSDLFSRLDSQEIAMAADIVKKVQDFTQKYREFLDTPENKATLIYQLAMVPFEKMPKWLDAIDEYYEKRISYLEKFDIEADKTASGLMTATRDKLESVVSGVYDAETNEELEKNRLSTKQDLEELKDIRKNAKNIIQDLTKPLTEIEDEVEKMLDEYRNLRRQIVKAISVVQSEDTGLIKAFVHDTYGYDSQYIEVTDSGSVKDMDVDQIKQSVLGVLNNISKKDILKLYNEENSQLKQSVKERVKEVIDSYSDGFEIDVYINSNSEVLPDSVVIHIDLEKEQLQEGLGGIELVLSLPPYNLQKLK